MQQQSELDEFEKQIKLKYAKYQEPVHAINYEVVEEMADMGVYPQEYIVKVVNDSKDKNYATATYNLQLKKKQMI